MALPALSNFTTWAGTKFKNIDWDSNIQTMVNILTNGAYDLNVNNITCNDITANSINLSVTNGVFVGFVTGNNGTFTPSAWLPCDGANKLIATYPDLFYFNGHTYGPGDGTPVTATSFNIVGNVCTITKNIHGLANDQYCSIKFTDVASGIVINRGVQISNETTNTFDFSIAGWIEQPQGTVVYNQATTFAIQDKRGYLDRGIDTTATIDPDAASRTDRGDGTTGAQVGTLQGDINEDHSHPFVRKDDSGATLDLEPPNTNINGNGIGITDSTTFTSQLGYGPRYLLRVAEITDTGSTNGWVTGAGSQATRFYNGQEGGAETRPVNFGVNYIVFSGV